MFNSVTRFFRELLVKKTPEYPKLLKVPVPKNVKRGKIEVLKHDGSSIKSFEDIKGSYRSTIDGEGRRQYREVSPHYVLQERIKRYRPSGYFPINGQKVAFHQIMSIAVVDLEDYVIDIPYRVWVENALQERKYLGEVKAV